MLTIRIFISKLIKEHKQPFIAVVLTVVVLLAFGVVSLVNFIQDFDKSQADKLKERADRYFSTSDFRSAVNLYYLALEKDPSYEDIYIILYNYYIDRGERDEAWEIIVTAIENTDSNRIRRIYDAADYPVYFESELLAADVRSALRLNPDAELWRSDMDNMNVFTWRKSYGDFSQLVHFRELTNFTAEGLEISDLTPFLRLDTVRTLNLNYNSITDISPLAALPNLVSLGFSHNKVTDLSPLADFVNLEIVNFAGNPFMTFERSDFAHIERVQGLPNRRLAGDNDYYVWDWASDIVKRSVENQLSISDGFIPHSTLAGLEHLDILNYDEREVVDLSDLNRLPNLTGLSLSGLILDLSEIDILPNLTGGITFFDCAIADTSPLSGLENLSWFSFHGCEIGLLSLDRLPLIDSLRFSDCTIDTFELGDNLNIKYLDLYVSTVNTVAPSAGNLNITNLNLSYVDADTLGKLTAFSNTEILYIYNNIGDLFPIAGFSKLKVLTLSSIDTYDLTPLAQLKNLETLNIYDYNYYEDNVPDRDYDFSALAELPRLTTLYLNIYEAFVPYTLPPIPSLESLTLQVGDSFDTSSVFEGLPNLKSLYFNGNTTNLNDLTLLSGLTNLNTLSIGNYRGGDLSPLSALRNLTSLTLFNWGYNGTVDISPLSALTNLTDLYIYEINVEDITPLAGLTKLERLYLTYGGISDITALAGLTSLIELNIGGNAIYDFSPLVDLDNLMSLETWGNPGDTAILRHIYDRISEYWDNYYLNNYDWDYRN